MSAAREFLMAVWETAYGVPKTTPVLGTDYIYVPLIDSNSFTPVAKPNQVDTPWGGGLDVLGDVQQDSYVTGGKLVCLINPTIAAFLLPWAITRINAGGTVPYTTTEPPNDLASMCFYHGITLRDGSIKRRKLPGTKCAGLTLECSKQDPRLKGTFDLICQKEVGNAVDSSADPDATEFPLPTDTQLARGSYLFTNTKGQLKLAGTGLTRYDKISLKIMNKIVSETWEDHFPTTCSCYGRESTLDASLLLKASPDLRSQMLANTRQSLSVKWDDGTHTLKIDFSAKNVLAPDLPYDLPLGQEFRQPASFRNVWDPTAGTDVILTTT